MRRAGREDVSAVRVEVNVVAVAGGAKAVVVVMVRRSLARRKSEKDDVDGAVKVVDEDGGIRDVGERRR